MIKKYGNITLVLNLELNLDNNEFGEKFQNINAKLKIIKHQGDIIIKHIIEENGFSLETLDVYDNEDLKNDNCFLDTVKNKINNDNITKIEQCQKYAIGLLLYDFYNNLNEKGKKRYFNQELIQKLKKGDF